MATSALDVKIAGREIIRGRHSGTLLTHFAPLEHKNGYVFLLADIDANDTEQEALKTLLKGHVTALAEGMDQKSHLQHRFEQALHVINTEIAQLIDQGQYPLSSLHMLVGVVRDRSFVVSAVGSPQALFLRKTAKQRFRMFDLAQSLKTELGKIQAEKVFSVVLDGDLQPDDVFLIASRELHNLLSIEDLNPLISTLPPTGAIETIEQYMPAKGSLAVMLLQARRQRELITGYGTGGNGSQGSLQSLAHTQEETERVLERERPQIVRALIKLYKAVRTGSSFERREAFLNVLRWTGRVLKAAGMYLLLFINNVAVSLSSLLLAAVSKPHKRTQALRDARAVWSKSLAPKKGEAREAALSGRFLVVAAALLIVLFIGSTAMIRAKQNTKEEVATFEAEIARAIELRESAETSIIYQDERYALEQLLAAEAILDNLSAPNAEAAETLQQQRNAIAASRDQVRHVKTPTITATPIDASSATAADQNLIALKNGSLNSIEGTSLTSTSANDSVQDATQAATYGSGLITLHADQRLRFTDIATSSATDILINSAEGEFADVRDMTHYGERLYVLTPSAIYRHQRVSNGEYGPATDWLVDPADLSGAQSLVIDGTIWIGMNGGLRRFEQGQEIGADTSTIDPAIGSATDLYTTADIADLYILDTINSRAIVYNKESGRMIAQYKDARFKDGISIWMNSATVYVTVASHVLSFPLSQ